MRLFSKRDLADAYGTDTRTRYVDYGTYCAALLVTGGAWSFFAISLIVAGGACVFSGNLCFSRATVSIYGPARGCPSLSLRSALHSLIDRLRIVHIMDTDGVHVQPSAGSGLVQGVVAYLSGYSVTSLVLMAFATVVTVWLIKHSRTLYILAYHPKPFPGVPMKLKPVPFLSLIHI